MKRFRYLSIQRSLESRPARGAWIETTMPPSGTLLDTVAPLAGCVDCNADIRDNKEFEGRRAPRGHVD